MKGSPIKEQGHLPVTTIPAALELVKDAVIFIQGAEFTAKVFMDLKQNILLSLNIHLCLMFSSVWI